MGVNTEATVLTFDTLEICQSPDGLGVAFQILMPEDSGSNPEANSIYSFDGVCPGLGLLQPQRNPYPTLPRLLAECVTSVQSVALSMVWQSVTTHGESGRRPQQQNPT